MMEIKATSIRLSAEHKAWLDSRPGGLTKTLRALITKAKDEEPLTAFGKRKFRTTRDRFLAAVRLVFHPGRACEVANVRERDLETWIKEDPDGFKAKFRSRQRDFLDTCEFMIVECARGHRHITKEGMLGLMALLNSHHPDWGRVKVEFLAKIFNPIFDALLGIVKNKVDDATYKEIAEEFQRMKRLQYLKFSE